MQPGEKYQVVLKQLSEATKAFVTLTLEVETETPVEVHTAIVVGAVRSFLDILYMAAAACDSPVEVWDTYISLAQERINATSDALRKFLEKGAANPKSDH